MSSVMDDWRALLTEIRQGWAEMREEWRETIAEIRQHKQLERRLFQRITGKDNPTRRERRHAEHAVLSEADELDGIARQVAAEHEQGDR